RWVDNYDIGVSAVLDIPRFISPFNVRQTFAQRTRTLISLNYSYRWRPEFYNRWVVGASFAYSWRQPRSTHTFFPLDVNLVNISLNPRFDSIIQAQNNPRLLYQYQDHFIFATRYNFSFSGEQPGRSRSFNAFRFSIESSGNSLFLLSNLLGASKHGEVQQYQFFNLAYAQYLRGDADFRRYWRLTDNQTLVTRIMGGVGFAYGNSMVLPYERGFFAGGNNNIRAWPMNQLGPGSFPDTLNIESVGDIVLVGNIEYRFPIAGAFKGALFVDAGNIWLRNEDEAFPGGRFAFQNIGRDLAIGGGFGLRLDLGFFVIRLDMAIPLRDPARPSGEKWVIQTPRMRDFVFNFGIGYPF
ncbi:MAG: outer membrane protein assembly factor, partial [Bacteroidales bacterium]|nr:outer membrane protein assembly factor [Bacteroidales bacterium]